MKHTIRVGIVGAGHIAEFHLRALRELPNVTLVGICDVDLPRARQFASVNGVAASCATIEELADRVKPDVVHVLTPPAVHHDSIKRCFEDGMAVFAEKPLVTNSVEGRALMQAQTNARAYAGVSHNAIFHPAFRKALDMIQKRQLGAVEHVITCLNVPLRQLVNGQHSHWMFAEPGNIVLEQGPHPLSQIAVLVGKAKQVAAVRTGEVLLNNGGKFYDTWQVALECERATAQCLFAFGKSFMEWWIYVVGQDGSLFVDLRRSTVRLCDKSRFVDPADFARLGVKTGVDVARQSIRNFMNYGLGFLKLRPTSDPFYCSVRDSIRSFYAAYRENLNPPVTLEEGCDVVELCEVISARALEKADLHGRP